MNCWEIESWSIHHCKVSLVICSVNRPQEFGQWQVSQQISPNLSFICFINILCPESLVTLAVPTRLSSSGSSLKNGFPSCSWWCTNAWMSTSKLSADGQSAVCDACSHFSNSRAISGNSGCLQHRGLQIKREDQSWSLEHIFGGTLQVQFIVPQEKQSDNR